MTWYGFAIAAGVTWGFTYVLNDRVICPLPVSHADIAPTIGNAV